MYKFRESEKKKELFLTFDDGPIPEVTPWVIETLNNYGAKATFFCIGDNVRKHPEIIKLHEDAGNTVANHTMNHLKGWVTPKGDYVNNVLQAEAMINEHISTPLRKMLRPPYGKIKANQAKELIKEGYEIILYDVIAYDWDKEVSPEKCYDNIAKNVKSGSIIVFHDSLKAERNMKYALPRVLEKFTEEGYTFKAL